MRGVGHGHQLDDAFARVAGQARHLVELGPAAELGFDAGNQAPQHLGQAVGGDDMGNVVGGEQGGHAVSLSYSPSNGQTTIVPEGLGSEKWH